MKNHLLRLLGAAVATVVLTPLVPLAATAADPLAGAPAAGTCYDLSGKVASDLDAVAERPTSCRKKHTLWVAGAAKLPAGTAMDFEDDAARATMTKLCAPLAAKLLGEYATLDYARSAYKLYMFLPTKAQQRDGARWVSCAFGIAAGDDKLVRNATKKPAQVSASLPDALSLCGTRQYALTNCASQHVYRPVHAQQVRLKTYYSDAKRDRIARRVCARHAEPRQGFMWSNRGLVGKRFVLVCLNPDRG